VSLSADKKHTVMDHVSIEVEYSLNGVHIKRKLWSIRY